MRLFIFLLMFGISQCVLAQSSSILLTNATLIDGDAGVAPRKGSILIEDGMIKKLSTGKKISTTTGTRVIDCTGKFIVPGMFDAHVHLGTIDLSNIPKARLHTDSILYNMIRHGITTVRDMAGEADFLHTLSTAAESNNSYSPSIYYAAQFAGPEYFRMPGSEGKGEQIGSDLPWAKSITDTTDIVAAVAAAKACGATGIKIYAELSAALVANITKEAKKQGLLAWAHASVNPASPAAVAAAGVNSMSHANDLVFQQFPEGTDLGKMWEAIYKGLKADSTVLFPVLLTMRDKRIYFDPTLFHAANNDMKNAVLIAGWAHRLGVSFVAGTDWIYPTANEPVPLLDELKHLSTDAGLSNVAIIQAVTVNAARATGLQDRGLLREGMRADLLILNSDPLKALDALFSPHTVLRKGVILSFK